MEFIGRIFDRVSIDSDRLYSLFSSISGLSYLAISLSILCPHVATLPRLFRSLANILIAIISISYYCTMSMIYNNILTKTTDNVSRFYNDNEQGEPVSVYIKLLYISLYGLILYYTANPLMTEFSEALAYLSDIEIVVTAISFSSVVAYSLMLLDRMVEIINPKRSSVNNGHTNSSSNNQNMLHLFNIASVIVLCMKFNIIQLALNNFMNILGLFILVPYIIDIHSLFKALNSDKKLFSNIFNKHSLSFNMTSLKQAYIYTLISISMFLDSIVNKFLLFIHIIAETAFAVAGQSKGNTGSSRRSNINMSAIIGIIAEYVIDSPSNEVTSDTSYQNINKEGSADTNKLLLALLPVKISFGMLLITQFQAAYWSVFGISLVFPLTTWLYYNINRLSLPSNIINSIVDYCGGLTSQNVSNILIDFCSNIAAAAQGLFTALELKELSGNVFSYSMILLTTVATVVIEGNVYKDLLNKKKSSSNPQGQMHSSDLNGPKPHHHHHHTSACGHNHGRLTLFSDITTGYLQVPPQQTKNCNHQNANHI